MPDIRFRKHHLRDRHNLIRRHLRDRHRLIRHHLRDRILSRKWGEGWWVQISAHKLQHSLCSCFTKRSFTIKIVYTSKRPSKPVFRWKLTFYPITPCSNDIIRFRIKFCIQHNRLKQQHKSSSESGADYTYVKKPVSQAKTYFFCPKAPSENSTIRFKIKFCIWHNRLER
jgi:hypothetical protein